MSELQVLQVGLWNYYENSAIDNSVKERSLLKLFNIKEFFSYISLQTSKTSQLLFIYLPVLFSFFSSYIVQKSTSCGNLGNRDLSNLIF
ncbi:MAG: hypothetical protein RMX97_24590 [Nostoc sp. DedQUE11]|nr:hypothetical protein [Nostoc sp. DedQUE11]